MGEVPVSLLFAWSRKSEALSEPSGAREESHFRAGIASEPEMGPSAPAFLGVTLLPFVSNHVEDRIKPSL